jgi:hypothetical protein
MMLIHSHVQVLLSQLLLSLLKDYLLLVMFIKNFNLYGVYVVNVWYASPNPELYPYETKTMT